MCVCACGFCSGVMWQLGRTSGFGVTAGLGRPSWVVVRGSFRQQRAMGGMWSVGGQDDRNRILLSADKRIIITERRWGLVTKVESYASTNESLFKLS